MSVLYTPTSLIKGIKGTFFAALEALPPNMVQKIATVVPSTAIQENYAWIGEPPQMIEQLDEVKFTPLSDASYILPNKLFSSGITVRRRDLEDEQVGGIRMRINQLAEVARFHPDLLLIQALTQGTSATLGLGYDGNAFFSTTHPARGANTGSGIQNNLLTATGTTTAQIQTDLNLAISALANFLAENGEPYHPGGVKDLVIVAPPALMQSMRQAVMAPIVAQTSNVAWDSFNLTVRFEPRLTATSATSWYLLHTGGYVRPLIFQDREPLEFSALEGLSDINFIREEYRYKCRARYNVGYGPWQHAVKVQ